MTDGHPVARLTRYFTEPTEVESAIDWPLMTEEYWNNTDADGDRERRRQAELLVHRAVAVEHLLGLAVRTPAIAARLSALLQARASTVRVLVRPNFYYGGKP